MSRGFSRRGGAAGVVVASLALLGYVLFHESDEDEVLACVRELGQALSTRSGENPTLRTLRIKKTFGELLSPSVTFQAPELSSKRGVSELSELAGSAPASFGDFAVSVGATDIRLDREHRSATAVSTVTLTGALGGELHGDRRQVHLELERAGGRYRVRSIDVESETHEEPEARP